MLSERHQKALDKNLRMTMMLGGMFLVSIVMYWLVMLTMPPQTPMEPETLKIFRWALLFIAVSDLAMTFVVKRAFLLDPALKKVGSHGVPQLLSLLMRCHLFVFAMAEAIAVFGFMLAIVGDKSPLASGLLVMGAAGIALHWPRKDGWLRTLERAKNLVDSQAAADQSNQS